jgi:hypothetical protein
LYDYSGLQEKNLQLSFRSKCFLNPNSKLLKYTKYALWRLRLDDSNFKQTRATYQYPVLKEKKKKKGNKNERKKEKIYEASDKRKM